ncbi:O-antigen export system permease protein RfbD [Lachnospiraceae bacterium KM106-2]|nr:O-antigen export system permease protein RfbD [Lachnospiraceae bacterium KM106-2]
MRFIKNFTKFRFLLIELVKKEIKLKYRRSYLGYVWTLLEPLLTTLVLAYVFGTLLGNNDPHFPVYILTGRLLYSFFSTSTKAAMRSIRRHSGMIKKVYVPKYIYPLSAILSNFVIFIFSLLVLVGACIVQGIKPTIYTLQAIFPLIILLVMALGVGLILSSLAVFFRDLEYLWEVFLMIVMYCCAIFYKADRLIDGDKGWILNLNPLYAVIKNFRFAILDGAPLGFNSMCYASGFSILVLVVGLFVFYKSQDKFILNI